MDGYDSTWKCEIPLERRKALARQIRVKYPEHVPIFVATRGTLHLTKRKFIVPESQSVAYLLTELRRFTRGLTKDETLFLFVGGKGVSPALGTAVGIVYTRHADEDGFLYLSMTRENAFG